MTGLEMKYFILKPKAKSRRDPYAAASQLAMDAYADEIEDENPDLADELREWSNTEAAAQTTIRFN